MSKNFKSIYDDTGDSSALEQKFFLKEETVGRGTFAIPTDADFIFTMSGGSVNFSQPLVSSPHRSGRHHLKAIKEKTVTSWNIPTLFNIDLAQVAATSDEIDPGMRLLHKSLLGVESLVAGAQYTPGTPNTTFTILENLDKMAKQSVGAFVESATMNFQGDGMANTEWAGSAKTSLNVGIAKLTAIDHSGGNVVAVEAGEGKRIPVGACVMLIESDGVTRSADTPNGAPRFVTAKTGDSITLDGAVLADADASLSEFFLAYYEPENPAAINEPVTGLVGSVNVAGFAGLNCVRNAVITLTNNHELQDNCYGETGLGGSLFIPGGRLDIALTLEVNMNDTVVEFLNEIRDDITGEDIEIILGDSSGRHLDIDMDRVIFSIPEVGVPESGSIPVTFESAAVVQSDIDVKDEISIHYK